MTEKTSMVAAAKGQRQALSDLCAEKLVRHHLILASNRGPVEFREENGQLSYQRGQGGLVTAMSSMLEVTEATWVACAMSEADERAARGQDGQVEVRVGERPVVVGFVSPGAEAYHRYYDDISNSVLWFLQHNIMNPPIHPSFDQALWDAWDHGYVRVNRMFADRLAEEAARDGRPPIFMVHDYHLYLVPGLLRERFPDAIIQHFTHIAWPSPDAWRQLPPAIRESIVLHLLGADVVGFHCQRYVFNFLLTCQELCGLSIDWEARAVRLGARRVAVRDYPISIDPGALREMADTPDVLRAELQLKLDPAEQLILQVARTDPSKNILRSFYAFEHFLSEYPDFCGRVRFLGLLPSSRQTTELYKEYLDELQQVAGRINHDYGTDSWQPIHLHLENDYTRAIAAMKHYDVLVVNSIADGMNLVAKEGPIVNRQRGVLILSEAAGAVDELRVGALVVNPFDLVGMAQAFYDALMMPPDEREAAIVAQRNAIAHNTIFRWAHDQLRDLLGPVCRPGPISWAPAAEKAATRSAPPGAKGGTE